jgi:histidinol dehydrogenase
MIKTITADGTAEYEALKNIAGRGGSVDGNNGNSTAAADDIEQTVKAIISDVRTRGDEAVGEYGLKFDGFLPDKPVLTREDMKAAYKDVDDAFRTAILHASENILSYHGHQIQKGYENKNKHGCILGQTVRGLDRVGLYVPGGTAAYPSTVLMNAIPAKLAGVKELIMVTPPRRPSGDSPDSKSAADNDLNILATAYVAGVDKIILTGGAQAIAALAYGTKDIPKVDKITGPGNIYVATAKRLVFGQVDIDMIAGPSEILIIADEEANPSFIAADLLSQAEHDIMAASILLTTSEEIASRTSEEAEKQLSELPRQDIARKSIEQNGLIILCRSEDEMVAIANEAAPEHLELLVRDPLRLVPAIQNAGSVFCGPYSPEPLGDYYSGTNHVLPTSGTARFSSPLGVYDFIKRTSYTYYTEEALKAAKDDIVAIGEAEGLTAHVTSVTKRFR